MGSNEGYTVRSIVSWSWVETPFFDFEAEQLLHTNLDKLEVASGLGITNRSACLELCQRGWIPMFNTFDLLKFVLLEAGESIETQTAKAGLVGAVLDDCAIFFERYEILSVRDRLLVVEGFLLENGLSDKAQVVERLLSSMHDLLSGSADDQVWRGVFCKESEVGQRVVTNAADDINRAHSRTKKVA